MLVWLFSEFARCEDEEADPEELCCGEMHLGAVDVPQVEMLSHDQMRQLHAHADLDGSGAVSLQELLECSSNASWEGLLGFEEDNLHVSRSSSDAGILIADGVPSGKGAGNIRFSYADQDGDGHLNEAEVARYYSPFVRDLALTEIRSAYQDQDGSGHLSSLQHFSGSSTSFSQIGDELIGNGHAIFRDMDLDGSGDIDLKELEDWENGRFHARAELARLVADADSDGDGVVGLDEFLGARDRIAVTSAMFHLLEWSALLEL